MNDSQARIIYVWDIVGDSVLQTRKVFATIKPTGYADGMKFDSMGNLFCSGPVGVWVFNPSGTCVDTIIIPSPDVASNCNWGDPDRKTLYITGGKTLYRIRIGNPTGIRSEGENLRNPSFKLLPNFPNPFNPTTAIGYQLSAVSHVTLKVFDVLGREIRTLVNAVEKPGEHEVTFDGEDLSSGIYFCSLSAGGLVETKAMVLLK